MNFYGYHRKNGTVGVRNYLVIMSTVICANEVAEAISDKVKDSVPILHPQGCCQMPVDLKRVTATLAGLGINPNVGAVLLVSLGCEGVNLNELEERIRQSGKPVEKVIIQEIGGISKAVEKGIELANLMAEELQAQEKKLASISDLVVGIKCGSSDTLSGLLTNPIVGMAVDKIIDSGGRVVFGEVTEMIGAENHIVKRIENPEIKDKIINSIINIENRAKSVGEDMREGQPTPGNIKGGLTTIEEKSLGAIIKSGSKTIDDFIEYGEQVKGGKLTVVDSPGREPELLTGLAAAGAQVIIFTTGRGAPQGYPICPVIKVTANPRTYEKLHEFIDVGFTIDDDIETVRSVFDADSNKLLQYFNEVCSGRQTKAEINKYNKFINIYITGPVI
ncbi:UxaA family hydrolase [Pelotomaculum sp. FP]|uniref:UxaA family hydrolase n=1 Tax=Pelotomaculum sp. FP TaxID=261474 RepID=UPI001064E0C3|nr:UxaA family hydrolase [Pelotomaculum sp. FP]